MQNSFFFLNLPVGKLSSVLKIKFFVKILCKNLILQAFLQSAQHLYERVGSGSEAIPQIKWIRIRDAQKHVVLDPVSDSDPQHCL
jgi:hypothetical protein